MLNLLTRFAHARVLVVHDAAFDQSILSTGLTKAGFRKIEVANDELEALEKTYKLTPDLVILDLNTPHLDGFGYCERVRNDASLPRMPVIVQTEKEDRESRLRALSCGADDFLKKPLDSDELALRICLHVERYFMLRDMGDMCSYLTMELEHTQRVRQHIDQHLVPHPALSLLDNHYEVMEQLIEFPTRKVQTHSSIR